MNRDAINTTTEFFLAGILDWAMLAILAITFVLVHHIKVLVAERPRAKRRTTTASIAFFIGAGMTLWYKWGDPHVYQIAFAIGVLNPTIYTVFITVTLSRYFPELADKLKHHKDGQRAD